MLPFAFNSFHSQFIIYIYIYLNYFSSSFSYMLKFFHEKKNNMKRKENDVTCNACKFVL